MPLRAVSEALGAAVTWDEKNKRIDISTVENQSDKLLPYDDCLNQYEKAFIEGEYGEELFYLTSFGMWDGNGDILLCREKDKMKLIYRQGWGRNTTRILDDAEAETLISYITDNHIDYLPDWDTECVYDGIEYLYGHCTGDGRSEIYINNPEIITGETAHSRLVKLFQQLRDAERGEVYYDTEKTMPDLDVLLRREEYHVQTVWNDGSGMQVLVREKEDNADGQTNMNWYRLQDGHMEKQACEPENIKMASPWGETKQKQFNVMRNNYPWETEWNGYLVCTYEDGLYLVKGEETPIFIKTGEYCYPIVVPGTDWLICTARTETDGTYIENVVKIDLKTGDEFTVNIPSANKLRTLTLVNDQVLIKREDTYYLFDAKTNRLRTVPGDWEVFDDVRERPLQPSSTANEYYAAKKVITSRDECDAVYSGDATIGKINLDTFVFTPIITYHDLYFTGMDFWVDEGGNTVYLAVNGDLIALPLYSDNVGNTI